MLQEPHVFPPMPPIGRPESYYADLIHKADEDGNTYAARSGEGGAIHHVGAESDARLAGEVYLFPTFAQSALRITALTGQRDGGVLSQTLRADLQLCGARGSCGWPALKMIIMRLG